MNKKEWIAILAPLSLAWIIDRVIKWWAVEHLKVPFTVGNLRFIYLENHGAMLGLFSDLPAVLRIVSLSTGGAFLLVIFGILQYLMPIKSYRLRAGMSLLLGGILGNVYDRIVYGYVIDYISFKWGDFNSPVFNFADFIQWVGYGLIFITLTTTADLLWPESESRKKLWVNPDFQIKHSLQLLAVGIGVAIISGVFSFTYFRVTILEIAGSDPKILNKFLNPYLVTYIVVILAFAAILMATGRYISHRVAGPVYAFEKYMREFMDGNYREFKVRGKDEFKQLEMLARDLVDHINALKGQAPQLNSSNEEGQSSGSDDTILSK